MPSASAHKSQETASDSLELKLQLSGGVFPSMDAGLEPLPCTRVTCALNL